MNVNINRPYAYFADFTTYLYGDLKPVYPGYTVYEMAMQSQDAELIEKYSSLGAQYTSCEYHGIKLDC